MIAARTVTAHRAPGEHIVIRAAEDRLVIAVLDPQVATSPLRRALARIHNEPPNPHTPGVRP